MVMPPTAKSSAAGPPCNRLELAVTALRRELEQRLDQESRLQSLYRDWQSRWSEHCTGLSHHLVMLEAHLSAWMQHWQPPRLTVVGGTEASETAGG